MELLLFSSQVNKKSHMPVITNKNVFDAVNLVIRNRHLQYPANFTPAKDLWDTLITEGANGNQHVPDVLNHLVREAVRVRREEEQARIITMVKKSASQ